jgi:hypothetical protein
MRAATVCDEGCNRSCVTVLTDLLYDERVLAVVHVEGEHVLAASRGAAAHALVRLGWQAPTVAASTAYGCSLHRLRLQPPPATTVAASNRYGRSLHRLRLQVGVLASTQRCSASRSYRATDSGALG